VKLQELWAGLWYDQSPQWKEDLMKHPLDHAKTVSGKALQRAIGMKKDALPRRMTLDLQKRPRAHMSARRATEFLRIARQADMPIWQR
jgi:hypothetical protein